MIQPSHFHTDVLIIGAGIAGLMAANVCLRQRRRVILVDKGRAVGGRLATRRIGPGRADHGAQFFTVREDAFAAWVHRWQRQGLAYTWAHGWSHGSLHPSHADGQPRYAVHEGMNTLAKHLAADLQEAGVAIHTGVQITALRPRDDGWQAQSADGVTFSARGLLLTPPPPQSLALLAAGQTTLAPADQDALARIAYSTCLCGLFWIEGAFDLPEPGALQLPGQTIAWIADNQRKGISPAACLITAQAGPEFSRDHWHREDGEVLALMQASLRGFFDPGTRVRESQLKRWRYSLPLTTHPQRFLAAQGLPPLLFAGDAFDGPRIEGAALSGLAAAAHLGAILSPA
ncbi:MAG: FAD-dependent oxidoreductase [Caldilineales bacterium]|nr:FAD-dependent oxidoreductase [Caldilineales bacterium]